MDFEVPTVYSSHAVLILRPCMQGGFYNYAIFLICIDRIDFKEGKPGHRVLFHFLVFYMSRLCSTFHWRVESLMGSVCNDYNGSFA